MRYILNILLALFLFGCATKNKVVSESDLNALKDVVYNKTIEFKAKQANPLVTPFSIDNGSLLILGNNSHYINLTNVENHVHLDADRISMKLPFFGQHNLVNNYNGQKVNLNLDQPIQGKTITYNPRKKAYTISMWVKGDEEALELKYTLYANNNASLIVDSTHRNTITYNGEWKARNN